MQGNMPTLNTAFKNMLGQILLPQGFLYVKQNKFFMRMASDEVLHYLSLRKLPTGTPRYKAFTISAGIRSIYTETLEKEWLAFGASDLINYVGYDYNFEQRMEIVAINYVPSDICEKMHFACTKTQEIILPKLEIVHDLNDCIAFYKKYRIDMIGCAEKFKYDSLLLIKADNHETFMKEFQKHLDDAMGRVERGESGGDYKQHYDLIYDGVVATIAGSRDKVYNDPELYAAALAELERRKIANTQTLKEWGVIS
ncbi:MAG: hypothetical protein LBN26_09350 [Christensenellaceae bacterium]|jgi:hypothetical protein|nr:hypothetical protein [Christensenellaceae bacterium]